MFPFILTHNVLWTICLGAEKTFGKWSNLIFMGWFLSIEEIMLEAKDQIINYRYKTKDYLRNIESIFN